MVNIYNHPPAEALFASRLMALPFGANFTIWTVVSLIAFGAALWLLVTTLQLRNPHRLLLIIFACTYHPSHLAHWLGQNTSFVLLGICGLYWAWVRRHEAWMGGALVLIGLKPQMLPLFALLLVLMRCWRALCTAAGIVTALTVAVMPILGLGWPIQYARYLLTVSNSGAVVAQHPQRMLNWRGLVINLSGDATRPLVTPVLIALSLVTMSAVIWLALRVANQSARDDAVGRGAILFAWTNIAAILIAPHLNSHDLALLIVPAWIVWSQIVNGHWRDASARRWGALLWLGWAVPIFALFGTIPEGVPVVANVLLLTVASVLLLRQAAPVIGVPVGRWASRQSAVGSRQ